MGILNQEVFVELCTNNQSFRGELSSAMGLDWYSNAPMAVMLRGGGEVNREAALEVYAYAKNYLMQAGYYDYKAIRPWEWDNSSLDKLDPQQAWWGFEFETGYQTQEDRAAVIEFTWDNFDNVCFDAEGEGGWYSEITFGPAERSKFLDGSADAFKFMQHLNDNQRRVNNTGYYMVGTHLNLSVPWARESYTRNEQIAEVLNNTLHMIPTGRQEYFGRKTIYGGAFSRDSYIELKLFRTTYSMEQFQKYLKSADALTRIAVAAENLPDISRHVYCSNFEELWDNPSAVPLFVVNRDLSPSPWESYVSGPEFNQDDPSYMYDDEDDYYDDSEENW